MKVKSLLFAAFALAFATANAQNATSKPQDASSVVTKGNSIISLGIGFGTTLYTGGDFSTSIPPISISYEYILKDGVAGGKGAWGIGGYLGYAASKWNYYDPNFNETYGWGYSYTVIGPRGYFHYNLAPKLDTYVGLMLGANIVNSHQTGVWPYGITAESQSSSGLAWAFFIGGRYFFNQHFGVMAEFGYGVSILNLGVSLKL
jgi:hypothetical protein